MNPPDIDDLWTRFLSDELTGADETLLVTALGLRADLREQLLLDAEMDGMLRSLGAANEESDQERFVASVLQRLEAEETVAPPPVVQPPAKTPIEDLPIADEIDLAPPKVVGDAPRPHLTTLKTPGENRQLKSWIAWSAYIAIAASLLIAFLVFRRGKVDDTLAGSDPPAPAPAPIGIDPPDKIEAPRPALAETDRPTESVPDSPPKELELLVPSSPKLVEDVSPPKLNEDQPPAESVEPAMSGFAVLVASSEDAQWYETPRELTGQRSTHRPHVSSTWAPSSTFACPITDPRSCKSTKAPWLLNPRRARLTKSS